MRGGRNPQPTMLNFVRGLMLDEPFSVDGDTDRAGSRHLSAGADRGYDTRDFAAECRELNITPHVARKKR